MHFLALFAGACAAASIHLADSKFVKAQLPSRQALALPKKFTWTSTGPLVGPKNDGRQLAGIKDPTIVEINGTYHVFASTSQEAGYNLVYFNFNDFNQASSATFHYLDQSGIGTGYRAAPQVFYHKPQQLWYLVYQNGNAAYSTNKDISNARGWTAPKTFYSGTPKLIEENLPGGYWVDMWVICDSATCHLFSSDDNGRLYRSQTPIANFPNGMSEPVIAMSDPNKFNLFEAACVYTIQGGGGYLMLIEAIGADNDRYFRSWTSTSLTGEWTPLAATEAEPFAGASNVGFAGQGEPWTKSISHGELIRDQTDQTLTINPCKLRFLYQGMDPAAKNISYNSLPWRLALITQTNSPC